MLIHSNDGLIRELNFDDDFAKVGSDPQLWQFKQFYDANSLGAEFVWPYSDWDTSEEPKDCSVEWLSKELFAVNFPSHISVQENHSLFIFPHYTSYIVSNEIEMPPVAVPQLIEVDWWPGEIKVVFFCNDCTFHKDKPFAQAIAIPRKDCEVKKMLKSEEERRGEARQFVETHKDEFVTRRTHVEGYSEQTNLYERLLYMKRAGKLPDEVKPSKKPKPRLFWK